MKKPTRKPGDNKEATAKSFFRDGDTLVLNIPGKPSASTDAIGKSYGHQVKVSVTAAPRAGRATEHMVRFLANEFDVATGDIEVVFGRMNVNKDRASNPPNGCRRLFPSSNWSDLARG